MSRLLLLEVALSRREWLVKVGSGRYQGSENQQMWRSSRRQMELVAGEGELEQSLGTAIANFLIRQH